MSFGAAHTDLRPLVGSLRSVVEGRQAVPGQTLPTWPFVTISREAGASGMSCGRLLADLLNSRDQPEHPWQCFDRELVERIAADHHLSADLVRSLETSSHTWISDFLGGLSLRDHNPSELTVFKRVVETVRSLAHSGHVILVGLGGFYITQEMQGGVHVRIVAPFDWRVDYVAREEHLSQSQARDRVHLIDRDRQAFLRKFWPDRDVSKQEFHITLNAGKLSEEQMARAIATLVPRSGHTV